MDFLSIINKYKDDLISDTQSLLRIPSLLDKEDFEAPFGNPIKDALRFMLSKAKNDGFETFNANNYAGHIEYGSGEILGILCHLDVVPTSGNWQFPPFSATIHNERIYARGAIDDKGPAMACYYALKLLKDLDIKLNKRVRLILGCDEETAMRGVKKYFTMQDKPLIAFSPDADFPIIYGEKGHQTFQIKGTDNEINEFYSGNRVNIVPDVAYMKIKKELKEEFLLFLKENNYQGEVKDDLYYAYGISAHAMHPHKGINAAMILFEFMEKHDSDLAKYAMKYLKNTFGLGYDIAFEDLEMGSLTMNLGLVRITNNEFSLDVDIRFPSDSNLEIIKKNVLASNPLYNYEFNETAFVHYVDPESDLVKKLYKSYQKYTNDQTKPFTIGGGTYSKMIENCVAFGPLLPNREDVVHQTNEYISIDDLLLATAIYADAIYELGK